MSFYDKDCDTVYLTAALHRHPHVFEELHRHLQDHGIDIYTVFDTDNVWIRDYFPIQVGSRYVKFHYGYGEKVRQYPQLGVPPFCYAHLQPEMSGLGLDGGNVVRYGDRAIVTDIIYLHNKWLTKKKLRAALEDVLDAEVIVIPHEPYDSLGHSDGIVKWIDEGTVFVNDYQSKYGDKVMKALRKHNLECVPFPYEYKQCPKMSEKDFRAKYPYADEFNPGVGYYLNFLIVKGLILAPQFDFEQDQEVLNLLLLYFPDCAVEGIECLDLSMEGGLLGCCTYQMRSDHAALA
jgi:agmatine deiminase